MSIFSKKTTTASAAESKRVAGLAVAAAQKVVADATERARKVNQELDDICEAERRLENENINRMESGQPLMRIDRSRLSHAQDVENASAHVLKRAERALAAKIEAFQEADHADRVARLNAAMRTTIDAFNTALAAGAALEAIFSEDPRKLTTAEFSLAASYMREWIGRADKHLNPPLAPVTDPDMVMVRFITGFPGREASPSHKRITAYGAGEIAGFDRAQAALLFDLKVAEPFTIPAPEEEPGEAPAPPAAA